MKYLVLRDCYVNDRFRREGETVNLPDDMRKSPKNFAPVDAPDASEKPSEQSHKHFYRKDGTCACGTVLSAKAMKRRERKANKAKS